MNPDYLRGSNQMCILVPPSDPWLAALVEMLDEELITCDDYYLLRTG
jgi:hypothetical protein